MLLHDCRQAGPTVGVAAVMAEVTAALYRSSWEFRASLTSADIAIIIVRVNHCITGCHVKASHTRNTSVSIHIPLSANIFRWNCSLFHHFLFLTSVHLCAHAEPATVAADPLQFTPSHSTSLQAKVETTTTHNQLVTETTAAPASLALSFLGLFANQKPFDEYVST